MPGPAITHCVTGHACDAEHVTASYGHEVDASVTAKFSQANLMFKYANYTRGVSGVARDTDKFWVQLELIL